MDELKKEKKRLERDNLQLKGEQDRRKIAESNLKKLEEERDMYQKVGDLMRFKAWFLFYPKLFLTTPPPSYFFSSTEIRPTDERRKPTSTS